jgi:hypothetical protein
MICHGKRTGSGLGSGLLSLVPLVKSAPTGRKVAPISAAEREIGGTARILESDGQNVPFLDPSCKWFHCADLLQDSNRERAWMGQNVASIGRREIEATIDLTMSCRLTGNW